MDQEQLYIILQQMQQQILDVQRENQMLKETVQSMKPITIENVNYKIQELHVKELKGTLNIGITGEAKLEDMDTIIDDLIESHSEPSHE
ncbi:hypothetical protein A374_13165 [Fictibacillus macauensis ZFHKF-1]|uniref:Spore germination protein GerPC n=1 Tax=Fictibacillus macauensis ZFHKF-1 TaxID=1196324 RepID=I8AHI0_9BACL|nr:spore germination protein GerPC [Fictibacillus macauensis]EIT84904.1 hypothetical protein A374_13165 [Fictibacillus macauensis ZFHKF-1]